MYGRAQGRSPALFYVLRSFFRAMNFARRSAPKPTVRAIDCGICGLIFAAGAFLNAGLQFLHMRRRGAHKKP